MNVKKGLLLLGFVLLLQLGACSRQQSDWEKTRTANTTEAYELFLKKYPGGEFSAQAHARLKELYEERDWQKARDTDTLDAYQGFLKQYPEGKWTEEARIRVENFGVTAPASGGAGVDAGAGAGAGAGSAAAARAEPAATIDAKPGAAASGEAAPLPPRVPASDTAPREPSAHGNYAIQLGAFKAGANAATARWQELAQNYPSLLAGLAPHVAASKAGPGALYRLQVIKLTEKRARSLCAKLQAKSQTCVVVPPRR